MRYSSRLPPHPRSPPLLLRLPSCALDSSPFLPVLSPSSLVVVPAPRCPGSEWESKDRCNFTVMIRVISLASPSWYRLILAAAGASQSFCSSGVALACADLSAFVAVTLAVVVWNGFDCRALLTKQPHASTRLYECVDGIRRAFGQHYPSFRCVRPTPVCMRTLWQSASETCVANCK